MTDRQTRWGRRLDRLGTGSIPESLIINETMISQWIKDNRAEYNNATETIKTCLIHFKQHRRHKKIVWDVYSKTDFGHLK